MKTLFLILLFVYSVVTSFTADHIASFFLETLFTFTIGYLGYLCVMGFAKCVKEKKYFKAFLRIIILLILTLVYRIHNTDDICLPALTPEHFRTNIITKQCNYGGGDGCVVKDPWYYTPDCESVEDKVNALNKSGRYEEEKQRCEKACLKKDKKEFCADWTEYEVTRKRGPSNMECVNITSCEDIDCTGFSPLY